MTPLAAAQREGITYGSMIRLLNQGRVAGAEKRVNRVGAIAAYVWYVPEDFTVTRKKPGRKPSPLPPAEQP